MASDKAAVKIHFDDGTFKTFLLLPKTTANDLTSKHAATTSRAGPPKTYYLYYTIPGAGEKCFEGSELPWTVWQPNQQQVKFTFKETAPAGRSPAPAAPEGPNRGTMGGGPAPGRPAAPPPRQPPPVSEDDFDSLLNQLTDIDVGGKKTSDDPFDLDLNFGSSNLPLCSACGEPVKNNLLNAFGLQWHKEHLACAICRRNFLENDVNIVEGSDGNAYCEKDYIEKFAPRCGRCSTPVQGQCTNALGKQWHPQCFTCATCNEPFKGTFFEHAGQAYCDTHYYSEIGLVCPTCQKPIIGKCVKARGQRYHPNHFQCCHCQKKLTQAEYFFHKEKIYCKQCSVVFFG
eukprot:TRINITY_DN27305_c0_g1_i1.p1 TRINITY_DN27305_c0_g1~~TRINITY_DN27305_c0_g1_i1.p1  ORF type:complete len:344 (+),score=66.62 TRINITY_DN27305_c0_g1_i1:62-1093(+)